MTTRAEAERCERMATWADVLLAPRGRHMKPARLSLHTDVVGWEDQAKPLETFTERRRDGELVDAEYWNERHGWYQLMVAGRRRDFDRPAAASHVLFADGGDIAGFVDARHGWLQAWFADCTPMVTAMVSVRRGMQDLAAAYSAGVHPARPQVLAEGQRRTEPHT